MKSKCETMILCKVKAERERVREREAKKVAERDSKHLRLSELSNMTVDNCAGSAARSLSGD